MRWTDGPASLTNPDYVATLVGLLAMAALYAYSATTPSGPTSEEITFVLLTVFLPMTLAHQVTRRWG